MEAFKAFAAFSLVDMLSSPLKKMKAALKGVDMSTANLSQRMGKLALSMAPVAVAAGVVFGMFTCATAKAIAFEESVSNIAKVVRIDTREELHALSEDIKELAGRLPVATESLTAIMAAAGQTGVAKKDLLSFAENASKIGIAFAISGEQAGDMLNDWRASMGLSLERSYALADAVHSLSAAMGTASPALLEVVQQTGGLGAAVGLAEKQVAALGAAMLSVGSSPMQVTKSMRLMFATLTVGENMSKSTAAAFRSLGFSTKQLAKDMQTDAQGTIAKVLNSLAGLSKEKKLTMLSEMFGPASLTTLAPLLDNIDNLNSAFTMAGDATAYAGSIQETYARASQTTAHALQLLQNKTKNLSLSIGSVFLPVVSWAAEKLGHLVDAVRWVVDTPFGQWLLRIVGGLSAAALGTTAVTAGIWGMGKIAPIVIKALLPLKAALLGLGWPVYAVIAAVGLLYLAYKKNFGGIADTLNRWWKNISLVFKGVTGIFKALTGSSFELRGELARNIKAAGLEGLVVNVAKIVYRIKEYFRGLWDGINFDRVLKILAPIGEKINNIFTRIGNVISRLMGHEVTSASQGFYEFGQIVGGVVSWGFEALATTLNVVANAISIIIDLVDWLVCLFTGDFAGACAAGERIWESMVDTFMSFADLFRIGDWLREAWSDATEFLGSINLFESGARILDTLKEGIASKFDSFKESISGFFSGIRDLLPFSDAKEGPFSDLTLSGSRLMTTLAEGAEQGFGALQKTVSGAFGDIAQSIGDWWDGLFSEPKKIALSPDIPAVPVYSTESDGDGGTKRGPGANGNAGPTYIFHIGQIVLQDIKDGKGFLESLEDVVAEYGGRIAPA